jgi:guanylate kinase
MLITRKLFIISGASGSGKTTLLKALERHYGNTMVGLMSVTTRSPRPDDETCFRYVSEEEFVHMESQGEFLWTKEVHGNRYGTRRADLESALGSGTHVISIMTPDRLPKIWSAAIDIGVAEEDILLLHVSSPGEDVLRTRLRARGDSIDIVEKRISDSLLWDRFVTSLNLPVHTLNNDGTPEELFRNVISLVERPTLSRELSG